MACHYSEPENEQHCIGWLWNQLNEGNNIGLRLSMLDYENAAEIEVFGKQHKTFAETFKTGRKK